MDRNLVIHVQKLDSKKQVVLMHLHLTPLCRDALLPSPDGKCSDVVLTCKFNI